MKYTALLCLLLVVVSTDGLSVVNWGWQRPSYGRFKLELRFAQIKLISKAYTNPGKATTKTFEKELLRVMRLAVEARIPEKEAAQQIIDEFELTFERLIDVEGILDYLEKTCETGRFPVLEKVSRDLVALRNAIINVSTEMCENLEKPDRPVPETPTIDRPTKGRS